MLAFKREGRGPFRHWGLLLCLPQTEKEEEKTRREPRDEEEQLHAEVELNEHFPDSVQPDEWRKRRSLVLTPLLATEWVDGVWLFLISDLPFRSTLEMYLSYPGVWLFLLSDLPFRSTFQIHFSDVPSRSTFEQVRINWTICLCTLLGAYLEEKSRYLWTLFVIDLTSQAFMGGCGKKEKKPRPHPDACHWVSLGSKVSLLSDVPWRCTFDQVAVSVG